MGITLSILDTGGIQAYVFASNRLRHHISASYLVTQATDAWLRDALQKVCGAAFQFEKDPRKAIKKIEDPASGLMAELVYCGGGNAVLLFDTPERARAVVRELTTRALLKAPGLNLRAAHTTFDFESKSLKDVYETTLRELAQKKWQQPPPMTMPGQSVTALCAYTSLPAVRTEKDPDTRRVRYLSAEVSAKRDSEEDARKALQEEFVNELRGNELGDWDFATNFEDYGEEDEHNYLAVVHADGNGMGALKQDLCQEYAKVSQNRELINALRLFSHEVNEAGRRTLQRLIRYAAERRSINEHNNTLLFTPVIYGGDDATFVCDGYLGLSLAALYLTAFNEECNTTTLLKGAQACAGVAMVKTHFPFARAYAIAADLCQNAKKRTTTKKGAYLDWHFAINGAVRELGEIRQREYKVDAGSLTLRPLSINHTPLEMDSWEVFVNNVNALKTGQWGGKRGKIKELRSVLRDGPHAVEEFLDLFDLGQLPPTYAAITNKYQTTGWHDMKCVYFDAIEAMEHIDVEPLSDLKGDGKGDGK